MARAHPIPVAFHAPMKPLDDPVPSGDRQLGRLIVRALEMAGHHVSQPTRFRSWDREGGLSRQQAIEREARHEAERLISAFRLDPLARPGLWLTYHLYHKAPDWIGPAVADALAIPYAVIEASRALKRREGPWSHGFAAADAALARADAVAALHAEDAEGLAPVVPQGRLRIVPPFIDAAPFQVRREPKSAGCPVRLVTVAMMREGDKLASYRLLAEALRSVADLDWRLTLVGDGPARDAVLALFPAERVEWTGRVEPERMPACLAGADLFVWPAIREAFGLVFLEAQAAGLPVIAGRSGGVPEIVRQDETGWIVPAGDAAAFAEALRAAISDPARLASMGTSARAHVAERHDIAHAAGALDDLLRSAWKTHAERKAMA